MSTYDPQLVEVLELLRESTRRIEALCRPLHELLAKTHRNTLRVTALPPLPALPMPRFWDSEENVTTALTNPTAALDEEQGDRPMDGEHTEKKPWHARAAAALKEDVKEASKRTAVHEATKLLQTAMISAMVATRKGREKAALKKQLTELFATEVGDCLWKFLLGSVIPLLPAERVGPLGPLLGVVAKESRTQAIATGMVALSGAFLDPLRAALLDLEKNPQVQTYLKEAAASVADATTATPEHVQAPTG